MSAPGFTMAAVAMMQIQQRAALENPDTNSKRLSSHQSPPSPDAFPRLKLGHRFKFKPLRRVLPSPYGTELLIAKGFYIDENQIIQKNPNSSFASVATQQNTTAFKAKSLSAPQGEVHAQPSENPLSGLSFTLDHLATTPVLSIKRPNMASTGIDSTKDLYTFASEQLSATDLTNIAPKTSFASTTNIAAMSLGQASSAKVIDTTSTSPAINIASPLLEKELPQEPTLRRAESPERRGAYGTFTSSPEKLNGVILRPNTPIASSPAAIGSNESNFDLASSVDSSLYESPELGAATSIQIRKVSGTDLKLFHKSGQLAPEDTGSPQRAATPRNTARRLPTTGQVNDFKNSNPVSKQLEKSKFSTSNGLNSRYGSFERIEQLTTSAKQSLETGGDVFGVDDFTRRSKNYGIGAKVRYANDAQNVIMGDKSGSESGKKLVGMSTNSMTSDISSPGSSSKSVTLECKAQIPHDAYPPRVSSLPASDKDVLYRLSRPTKASLARAQANTQAPLTKPGTMASVKKFLTRPSSMLAGRGRPDVSLDKSRGIGGTDKKSSTTANIACLVSSTNATGDDNEPPTLPAAGPNVEGHCSEGGQQHENYQQELQRELDRLRGIVAITTSLPSVYADFNQLSAQAQSITSSLTLMANQVDDQEARNRMWNVIRAVGESLALINPNTSAIIAFSDANQRLLTATACLAESATAFAGRVAQTNATQ